MIFFFKFFQDYRELVLRINLVMIIIFIPFLPNLLPFMKIEPDFTCTRDTLISTTEIYLHENFSSISKVSPFFKCTSEQICGGDNVTLNSEIQFTSFVSNYYKILFQQDLNEKIKINCQEIENSTLNNFYLFYTIGIIIASILEENYLNSKFFKNFIIILLSLFLNIIFLILIYYGKINLVKTFSLGYTIFSINFGFYYYLITKLSISQFIHFKGQEERKDFLIHSNSHMDSKNLIKIQSFELNFYSSISSLLHILIFYYHKNWVYNFSIFAIFSVSNLIIFFLIYRIEEKENKIIKKIHHNNSHKNYVQNFQDFQNFTPCSSRDSSICVEREKMDFDYMVKIQVKEKINPIKGFSSTHNLTELNILNPDKIDKIDKKEKKDKKFQKNKSQNFDVNTSHIPLPIPTLKNQIPIPKVIPIHNVPYLNTMNHKVSVISNRLTTTQTLLSSRTHRLNQHYSNLDSPLPPKKNQKNNFHKFKKFLKIISCKKHNYFINITLFLMVNINHQFTNFYIDKFSYIHFSGNVNNLFLNGVFLYSAEILSLITFDQFRRKFLGNFINMSNNKQLYAELCLILVIALCCTIIQVAIVNSNNELLLLFLTVHKFASVYLMLIVIIKLENTKDVLMFKNRRKMSNISRISVFVSYYIINSFQNSFLLLASVYYICFLVIIKIVL
jgi:hypothetical protein